MASPSVKKDKKHTKAPPKAGKGLDMDDYFNEGEKKSRELDYAPSAKSAYALPPPKAGGPPRSGPAPPKPEAEAASEPTLETDENDVE